MCLSTLNERIFILRLRCPCGRHIIWSFPLFPSWLYRVWSSNWLTSSFEPSDGDVPCYKHFYFYCSCYRCVYLFTSNFKAYYTHYIRDKEWARRLITLLKDNIKSHFIGKWDWIKSIEPKGKLAELQEMGLKHDSSFHPWQEAYMCVRLVWVADIYKVTGYNL